jgi:CDP-diacylglycerol--glycerol-3-phosphate 3-phosphatidyltransferase
MTENQSIGKENKVSIWNLANYITMVRIIIVPLIVTLLYFAARYHGDGDYVSECILSWISCALVSLVSITDFLDGWVARRYNLITPLGKLLDPMADKLLILACLIMLIPLDRVPAWIVFAILGREIFVLSLRELARQEGLSLDVTRIAKWKTTFQIIATILLVGHYDLLFLPVQLLGEIFLWIALFITVYSGGDYLVKFIRATSIS